MNAKVFRTISVSEAQAQPQATSRAPVVSANAREPVVAGSPDADASSPPLTASVVFSLAVILTFRATVHRSAACSFLECTNVDE